MGAITLKAPFGANEITLETGKLAKLADGAVTVTMGGTMVLVTACGSKNPRPGVDFLPLTCEYVEKMYAAGRIPGGYFKREGRLAPWEILVARLIDRPNRPLFPKAWRKEIQIIATVLSADGENDPDWLAADLLAQAEHDTGAQSILITDDENFGRAVEAVLREVPGVRPETVFADRVVGKPYLEIALDREAIGREKAGIFRAGKPAICADPQPPASLLETAQAVGAALQLSGRDFGFSGDRTQWRFWGAGVKRGGLAYPALRGANQLLNAAAVIAAIEAVRDQLPVPMQAIREGLMLVDLPGRFQTLPGQPAVVLDVAHNPQAVGVLAENLSNMGYYPETWAVVGMLADKAVEAALERIAGRVDHWLPASLPGPRGLSAEALAKRMASIGLAVGEARFESPADAYRAARARAQDSDRIVVFGSFLTVADAMAAIHAER